MSPVELVELLKQNNLDPQGLGLTQQHSQICNQILFHTIPKNPLDL